MGKRAAIVVALVLVIGATAYIAYRPAPVQQGNKVEKNPLGRGESATSEAPKPAATIPTATQTFLRVCSFNIQFLGNSKTRDNQALATLVKDFDLVVVQELVAPPYTGTFPNGEPFKPDSEAAKFFDPMKANGFEFKLSEEDTGTGDTIHSNGTSTEWFVTFFKPTVVGEAKDLPSGFLADDRSNHPDYERVPYAFGFRAKAGAPDFVLISVHLMPGDEPSAKARRKHELASIAKWIDAHDDKEKDFIILGDMNIEDAAELADATPQGRLSLNDECRRTNTLINDKPGKGAKPYDQVMYNTTFTKNEIDLSFDFKVIDLIEAMRPFWPADSGKPYPGDPYDHDKFRTAYSDHHPVEFRILITQTDDD